MRELKSNESLNRIYVCFDADYKQQPHNTYTPIYKTELEQQLDHKPPSIFISYFIGQIRKKNLTNHKDDSFEFQQIKSQTDGSWYLVNLKPSEVILLEIIRYYWKLYNFVKIH